ncbi:LysR family transcriptional regulator [Luteolibacter sp. Populi]|uniref:LysR family transcriptional regulator n=1 Tax=Luteolibacter sp. Populi TaxID=3230487 RepID=UPI0034664ECE
MDADLHCLETFVLLADCGSFSETAVGLGISQPAVSQRVAKLESVTGLRLFLRSQESLTPTREGRELLGIARHILGEHQRLGIRMARHVRESKGTVRVMLDNSFASTAMSTALSGDSSLDIEFASAGKCRPWVEALELHEVDLVVTGSFLEAGNAPSLQRVELERQRGTTIAWNRVYFDFDPARFKFLEILRSTLLVPSERLIPGYLPFLERWCSGSYGMLPPELIAYDDELAARDACLTGLGILIFPGEADLRMQIGGAGLGIVKTSEFPLPDAFSYSAYLRKEEQNPKVLATAAKIAELHRAAQVWERRLQST